MTSSANRRHRRLAAALVLALFAGSLTWWRSPASLRPGEDLAIVASELPAQPDGAGPRATGLWRLAGTGAGFGGFSALLAMEDSRLLAFSDRGWRVGFGIPGETAFAPASAQVVAAAGHRQDLFDIESAAHRSAGGDYWLGYEATHAIHRFSAAGAAGPVRLLASEVDWPDNSGAEALVALADGRLLAFAEARDEGYMFEGDPAEGAAFATFPVAWPHPGYVPTDAGQLADGRVVVLMRYFEPGIPYTFHSLLVAGDVPAVGTQWRPAVFARLEELLPRENYEGLAVRALPDGASEIWLISDDNFSAFQQTLLARLVIPAADDGQEKAREE